MIAAADVILRYGNGEIAVTGWGWLFFFAIASAASASITNYFRRDR